MVPNACVVDRNSGMLGTRPVARTGISVAPCPTPSEAEVALVQVLTPIGALIPSWYLFTPTNLHKAKPMAAFVDQVLGAISALKVAVVR